MPEQGKLRLAVLGCGMICQEHMQGFAELKNKVEIVAAVDQKEECRTEAHERWGIPENALFADWNTMLETIHPDAVDLCLPNYEHFPAAMAAISAGCHVFCEKPLGMNVNECERMIAAAKEKQRKLAVGFQQEYCPSTEILVNARNAGFFGELRFVHGSLIRRRGIPNWGTYYRRELGGGPVLDILVHLLDVITHVCGRPEPERLSASYFYGEGKQPCAVFCPTPDWNSRDYNVEDLAAVQIAFRNGLVLQLETSYINHIREDCVYDFKLSGSRGGAWWQNGKAPELYADAFGAMMNMTPAYLPPLGRPEMFRKKLDNWIQACLEETPLLLPGEIGLYIQRMLDAIARSAQENREIPL